MNYELSLWFNMPHKKTENNVVTNEWSREVKSGILANSDYKTPFSAYDIALEEKINGEKSLTFTMPSRYYDIKTETYKDNPFTTTIANQTKALLFNGSLLKLRTDKGVYNFVIDEITKNSENDTYNYSCSNANLLQLARSGYNLEFNTELENNMGNIFELGEKTVDGIDWHVVDDTGVTLHDGKTIKSDIIQAWSTEALYSYTLRSQITATNMEDQTTIQVPSGQIIYISSNSYLAKGNTLQFLWVNNGAIQVNEQLIITNSPNYTASLPSEWSGTWPTLYATANYRGKMLQTSARTKYITNIDKICNLYKKSNIDYYGYSELEYLTSESIQNMISENTNIVDVNDWTHTIIDTTIINQGSGETAHTEAQKYAQITYYEHNGTTGTLYYPECTTINSCKAVFQKSNGFSKSIHYYFCYKPLDANQPTITNVAVQARSNNTSLATYDTYYTSSTCLDGTGDLAGYKYFDLTTTTDLSYENVSQSNIKLVLTFTNPGGTETKTLKFTDIKFFQVMYDSNNHIIVPDISKVVTSIIKNKWFFFPVSAITDSITSINQLTFSDICYEKDNVYNTYILQTNSDDHYELVTSIEVKESNRFNIIQSLCEKFECWANLYIDSNDYGETLYKYLPVSTTDSFISGKQYYVIDGTPTGEYFDDIHFKYANLDNIFSNSDADYYYNKADKYYKKVNNMWVRANLGHQWGEHFPGPQGDYPERQYYTLSYTTTDGVTSKTWTLATTYNAGQTYYIKDNQFSGEPNYERVSVGNQFATDHTQYYLLNTTWYANLYQKYYSKFITFNEYTGRLNLAGFKYGINLSGITRSLDSSNLVTKLIVADNSNEFATNGYCSIADASQNAMGSNSLFNFSYYLSSGLMDKERFQRDMYGSESGTNDLAYAMKYGQINNQSIKNIDEIAELTTALIKLESQYSVYDSYVTQAHKSWIGYVDDIQEGLKQAGITKTWNDCADNTKVFYNETTYSALVNDYIKKRDVTKTQETTYKTTVDRLSGEVDSYNAKLKQLSEEQSGYTKLKEALDYEFHQRYQNYVREGTWSSDDYYDPEQYYFDANDVLLQSSFPTISYTFNVEDLSDLEGWRDYNFSIGDKTYVRDTEFFKDQDSAQMEVIISAITWQLDRPWDTSITVQNYTTEFQDLFSKMEAATQVLQYNEAKYEKAGTMATDQVEGSYILSNILSNNTNIITTADGKFTYDNNGITAIDANTKYQLKLTSRGLVLSKDGGATWSTGISGQGINAEVITTGTLNVDNIQIYGGASNKQFEWDKYGINAYTGISGSNLTKYVRFCKHGLYGTSGMAYNSEFTSPAQIINSQDVSFALTWEGMVIRSNRQNGTYAKIEADSQTGTTDTFTLPHYEVYSGAIPAAAGITVYEFNNSSQCYIVTSDTSRQLGKTYYQVVSSSTTLKRVLSIGKTAIVESYTQDIPYFVVYEDGTLRANNGIFNGIIECQDIRNKSGASMLNSNDTIKYSYLDLGGIVIDGPNSQITIKSAADASANTPSINITNSALNLRGALIHMYSQNTAGGNRNYARISFHNQYDAETSQQYGYVGAGSAVMGTGTSTQTGIVISSTDTDDYSGDTAPYFCVSSDKTLLYNHGRYLLVKTDGVYFNNGDGEHLVGTGGGSGGGTAIAVFG